MKENSISQILIEQKAVFIKTDHYFTWTSGIKSPIYCDNRLLISHVSSRTHILNQLAEKIKNLCERPDYIVGTATAGIPWAAWLAQILETPLLYVRSEPKKHGRMNAIEGEYQDNKTFVLIEDLVSTGKSALNAYQHLCDGNLRGLGLFSLFSYDFPHTKKKFEEKKINFYPLCTLEDLLQYCQTNRTLSPQQFDEVIQWRNQVQI